MEAGISRDLGTQGPKDMEAGTQGTQGPKDMEAGVSRDPGTHKDSKTKNPTDICLESPWV